MSPGSTMIRVYDDLKARIMAGDFAPGSRLDPMRLRRELGSSATPIRDALHRLTGERLIESGRNEGFRVPQVSEPAIRDLLDWSHDVTHIVRMPHVCKQRLRATLENGRYAGMQSCLTTEPLRTDDQGRPLRP